MSLPSHAPNVALEATAPSVRACARYGQPLGPGRENYKLHVQFRQFCCPACGGLIENEVCRAQDPVLWDIELAWE